MPSVQDVQGGLPQLSKRKEPEDEGHTNFSIVDYGYANEAYDTDTGLYQTSAPVA